DISGDDMKEYLRLWNSLSTAASM
ncbi:MAG: hypothetical protein K0R84_1960, partial [Clostridia bacterium]|nr:hypothetical protein [Clostridia bacterium]